MLAKSADSLEPKYDHIWHERVGIITAILRSQPCFNHLIFQLNETFTEKIVQPKITRIVFGCD